MLRFITNRLLQGIIVLIALYTITFFLIKAMPGDPFTGEKNIAEETKQLMREKYGLNESKFRQYFLYLKNVFTEGSLGISTSKAHSGKRYDRPIFSGILHPGVDCVVIRDRLRCAHRGRIGGSQKQLGRLLGHGVGYGRHLRTCIHRGSALADHAFHENSAFQRRGVGNSS